MTVHAVPVSRSTRPALPRTGQARPSLPTPAGRVEETSDREVSPAWEDISPDEVPPNPFVSPSPAPPPRETPAAAPGGDTSPRVEPRRRAALPTPALPAVEETAVSPVEREEETPRALSPVTRPEKPALKKVRRAHGAKNLRTRQANAGGIVIQPDDER